MRIVVLDSGPVGLVANPLGGIRASDCQRWARGLMAAGVRVVIAEIADYEVRRDLIRDGATAGLARLDRLQIGFDYAPITTAAMQRAAELWAQSRARGRPTGPDEALDGDAILAAQALELARPGDVLTVATDNIRHLAQWVDAKPWDRIVP